MGDKYTVFETDLGFVGLVSKNKKIVKSTLPYETRQKAQTALGSGYEKTTPTSNDPTLKFAADKIKNYLAGKSVDLNEIEVDFGKTAPFFRAVWSACREIKRGEVRSYGQVAAIAGRVLAARAVGQAMSRNKLPILIPCHRVINSKGELHNFGGGGIKLKARLLQLEGYQKVHR